MNSQVKSWAFLAVATLAISFSAPSAYANCGACTADKQNTEQKTPACAEGMKCTACVPAPDAKASVKGNHINTFQMKAYVDAGKAVILDARTGKYDDGNRIPGAKSLNGQSGEEEVSRVIPNKDSLVVTYCKDLQCPASNMLAEHLQKLGYTNVLEYPDGIAGWRAAGGPVTQAK